MAATYANGCASASTPVTISVTCPAITISPEVLNTQTIGTQFSQSLSASGGSGSYRFELVESGNNFGLPTGVNLASNGTISGTPSAAGRFFFVVRVTDSSGCSAEQTIQLPVGCAEITISPIRLADVTFGSPFSQSITASGGAGPYTFTLIGGALPEGVTFSSDGTISGTPLGAGRFFFTVRATDRNECSSEAELNLGVGCPTITLIVPDLQGITAGNSLNRTFSASGGSGRYFFSASGRLPTGVSFSSDGTLSGIPTDTGYFADNAVIDSFTINVTATDLNNCSSATVAVTFTVGCPEITPTPNVLPDATVGVQYDQTITLNGVESFTIGANNDTDVSFKHNN